MGLMSSGVLHSLSDGSIMELTGVVLLLPLSILLIIEGKHLSSGIAWGLTSLNILSLIEATVMLTPWLIYILVVRRIKSLSRIVIGFLVGGNIFLLRIAYKIITEIAIPLIFQESPPGIAVVPVRINLLNVFSSIYGNDFLFLVVALSASIAMLSYYKVLKKDYEACDYRYLLLISMWILHTLLIMVFSQVNLSISHTVVGRLARINLFLASMSLALSLYLIGKLFLRVLLDIRDSKLNLITNKKIARNMLCFTMIVAIIVVLVVSPNLYESLHSRRGLIRIDEKRVDLYMNLRNDISQLAEGNYTILGVSQVSSWSSVFLTIPEKHIQTYLITHPLIYEKYAPTDPNRIIGLKLFTALINLDLNTFKEYGVRYILREFPNR